MLSSKIIIIYILITLIVAGYISYINLRYSLDLLDDIYDDSPFIESKREWGLRSVKKGVMYGLMWPISVPTIYYDYTVIRPFRQNYMNQHKCLCNRGGLLFRRYKMDKTPTFADIIHRILCP